MPFGVTEHPTQEWTLQQLREAFPWDQAPRYLLRDRDAIYGKDFSATTPELEMEEVLTAPRSRWQNSYAERRVGSIRRECRSLAGATACWNGGASKPASATPKPLSIILISTSIRR